MKHPLQERHKRTEGITLNDVLTRFNPYHGAADYDSLRGALAVNTSNRAAFHDLFVLQELDQYYQQERLKTKK